MKNVFMSAALLVAFSTVFITSTPDPYEGDKARVVKAIKTVGNSEILQDVKFEVFEPAGSLMVEESDRYLDSLYDKKLAEDIDFEQKVSLLTIAVGYNF